MEFEPLGWGISFKNLDGGQTIEKAISQLKRFNEEIRKTKEEMKNMPSLSQQFRQRRSSSAQPSYKGSGAGFSLQPDLPSWMNKQPPGMASSSSGGSSPFSGLSSFSAEIGVATAAIGALAYAGYKTYDALMQLTDNMVKVFSERESSLRTYGLLLGDSKEAKNQYFKEAALAQKTELTQTDVRGFSSRLITAGFREDALERARMNIADLVTMKPVHMRTASSNQLAELYSKVQGAGYIQEGLINRTASRFVQTKLIYDEIAKSLQIKPEGVRAALKDRKVTSDVFFDAFQKASMKQLNEKKLGEFATSSAGSLGGLLSNLDEAQENLLRTIDPSRIQGVTLYKDAIQRLTDTITAGTKSGDNLRYFLEDMSDIGTSLKAIGLDTVSSFLSSFGEEYRATMQSLGIDSNSTRRAMSLVADGMKTLGKFAGENLGPAIAHLVDMFNQAAPAFKKFAAVIVEVGDFIIQSLQKTYNFYKSISRADDMKQMAKDLGADIDTEADTKEERPRVPYQYVNPTASTDRKAIPGDLLLGDPSIDMPGKSHSGGGSSRETGQAIMWKQFGLPMLSKEYTSAADPYAYPTLELYRDASRGFARPMTAYDEQERKVEVGEINIVVQGDGLSPEDISTEIISKLSQTFGRLARAPSPGGI